MKYQLYWAQVSPPADCLIIAENDSQVREALGVEEVVPLGPLPDEAVAQELEAYGGEIPCPASMHMVRACCPDAVIEPDSYGQTTRLRVGQKEVHLNFDVLTKQPSEESLALWSRTDGQA